MQPTRTSFATVLVFLAVLAVSAAPAQAREHEIFLTCPTGYSPNIIKLGTALANEFFCLYAVTASVEELFGRSIKVKDDVETLVLVRRITWSAGKLSFTLADGRVLAGAWGSGFASFGQRWGEYAGRGSRVEVQFFWTKSRYDKTGSQILKVYIPEAMATPFFNCTELVHQQEACTIK